MAPKSSRLTPFSDETVLALAKHMHWFFSPVDLDEKNKTVGINHTMHTEWTLYHFILYYSIIYYGLPSSYYKFCVCFIFDLFN